MAHDFHSGIMMNGEPGWHDLGDVIEGTLPAREAFTRAGALFEVEKRPLFVANNNKKSFQSLWDAVSQWNPLDMTFDQFLNLCNAALQQVDQRVAVCRSDNGVVLGTVSPQYELIQNETLCQLAEMLRDDIIMDTVVVLKKGAKVAFTGKILGTDASIVEGDKIHRNFVGYLGHDGMTSFGGIFTDIRVVCQNTLGFAQADGARTGKQFSVNHTKIGVAQIDEILRNIDIARQTFGKHVEEYKRMAETPMDFEGYKAWLSHLYNMPSVVTPEGIKHGTIEDSPRKWEKLRNAYAAGYGTHLDGVQNTVWGGYNAITEVETSLRDGRLSTRFQSATWGQGSRIVERARISALQLCGVN